MSWFGSEHECGCNEPIHPYTEERYDKDLCRYGLWAPGRDNVLFERDVIGNTAFNLYAMEEEGLFLSREEKIETVINYLSSSYDPNDRLTQEKAFKLAHLDADFLTPDEVSMIENEVAKRWTRLHM